jgi:hypothetical protein
MIAFWAILATAVVGMLVMIWRLIGRGPVAPDVEPLAKGGEGA